MENKNIYHETAFWTFYRHAVSQMQSAISLQTRMACITWVLVAIARTRWLVYYIGYTSAKRPEDRNKHIDEYIKRHHHLQLHGSHSMNEMIKRHYLSHLRRSRSINRPGVTPCDWRGVKTQELTNFSMTTLLENTIISCGFTKAGRQIN